VEDFGQRRVGTLYEDKVRARVRERPGLTVWTSLQNGFGGLFLRVTEASVEVGPLGPFRRLGKVLGLSRVLDPSELTISHARLGRFMPPAPPFEEWIVLARQTERRTVKSLAVRPADGDLDRLQNALRTAGVREANRDVV
jgi:hypothetical protein